MKKPLQHNVLIKFKEDLKTSDYSHNRYNANIANKINIPGLLKLIINFFYDILSLHSFFHSTVPRGLRAKLCSFILLHSDDYKQLL